MFRFLLKIFRAILLVAVSAAFIPPVIIARLIGIFRKKTGILLVALLTMLWSRVMCLVLSIRVSIFAGRGRLQAGFTVSNHVSYLDILVLGRMKPSIFIAKDEVSNWPGLGHLARLGNTVFINRKSARDSRGVLPNAGEVLDSGASLVLFPEGTSTSGEDALPFRSMVFDIPAKRQAPVLPISIKYRPVGGREYGAAWYGDASFLPHLWELLGEWAIDAMVYVNEQVSCEDEDGTSTARKRLATRSRDKVEGGLRKLEAQMRLKISFNRVFNVNVTGN